MINLLNLFITYQISNLRNDEEKRLRNKICFWFLVFFFPSIASFPQYCFSVWFIHFVLDVCVAANSCLFLNKRCSLHQKAISENDLGQKLR